MPVDVTDRVLAWLGMDLDFSFDVGRDPFNLITEDLYLGARPLPEQVPALKDAGITHVASCLQDTRRAKVAFLEEEFDWLFIPMRDGINEDVTDAVSTFARFVDNARQRNPQAKVLVHCEVGVSRSATLATALLMLRSRSRFFEAFCAVRAKRREVLPNIGFATQLQQLEFEIHSGQSDNQSVSSLARYLREVCMVPVELEILQNMLRRNDYDALKTIRSIFGDEIPRVIQGVRL